MTKTYDEKCYDLAYHFLQDEPAKNRHNNRDELAKVIQQAAEDWLSDKRQNASQTL